MSVLGVPTLLETSQVIGFDLNLTTNLAMHIFVILVLFGILAKILFNPVRELLRKRREEIAKSYEEIKVGKSQTAKLKADYEGKIANIQEEADEMLSAAHKKSLEQQKEIIAEAKKEAERIISRAKLEVTREQEKARDELKQEIVGIASLMASKFIKSSMDEKTSDKLLQESINEIGDSLWKD